ncbi:VanZ-like domain-containing protein [Chryseobacterium flavum]
MLKGVFHIKNGKDLFYYLWIVLVFPILDIVFFSLPIYYSLKKKKIWLSVIFACFIIEYILFVYSKKNIINTDAIANFIISTILFTLFFYRTIWIKFTES